MKKKINIEELTAALNSFIQSNKSKTFTRQEIGEKMIELGFNDQMTRLIIPRVFPFEKLGASRLYGLPKSPVYKGIIEGCYKTTRNYSKKYFSKKEKTTTKGKATVKEKPTTDSFVEAKEVNDAIHLLLSKGYKVSRPLGLDVKALLADHPELAQKYMRYVNI
jgi:hypothetical protein